MRLLRRSATAAETKRWGELLGQRLEAGDVVALFGRLGAGKTCFAQGIARGLGVGDDVVVTSPSFVIVGEYRGRHPFYHLDLYRLGEPAEIHALGLEEYVCGDGVTVLEWAQKARWLLGPDTVRVWIQWRCRNDERTIIIDAPDSYLREFPSARTAE
jgi:tRNA threonylcarbamoyladenosine biosynthesis protein TsaE